MWFFVNIIKEYIIWSFLIKLNFFKKFDLMCVYTIFQNFWMFSYIVIFIQRVKTGIRGSKVGILRADNGLKNL